MTAIFRNTATLTAARLGLATPPTWARLSDTQADASEAWGMATDPQNERGELCTAHFDYADVWDYVAEEWVRTCVLQGVEVKGGSAGNWTTTYHTRADLVARLGQDWIDAVENTEHPR